MLVAHVLQSGKIGGLERLVLELAEAQSECMDVALCFGKAEGPFWERAQSFLAYDLKIPRWLANPLRVAAARKLLGGFSLVHYHYFHPAFLKVNSPGVFTFHGQTGSFRGLKGAWTLPKFKRFLGKVRPVAVSKFAAAKLEALAGVKAQVVYNGLFIERIRAERPAELVREELGIRERVLVFTGRLARVKRLPLLLKAAAEAKAAVVLVGDGAERQKLESLARELGVRALFLGFREDVYDIVAAADAFVLPSKGETFSISTLEAMALGVPVVVMADGGGVLELVGEAGLVAKDERDLKEKILQLLNDSDEREYRAQLARERALEFHIIKTAKAYEILYQEVLGA